MKDHSKKTSLWKYLEPYLERNNQEEITQAKKEYYRKYKAEWRRKHRLEQKEYTVSFNKLELQEITNSAKQYHRSVTQFIKAATISTSRLELLIPDEATFRCIEALLTKNYSLLERIEEQLDDDIKPLNLLPRFEVLEKEILKSLKPQRV
jgi:hypothetical protein